MTFALSTSWLSAESLAAEQMLYQPFKTNQLDSHEGQAFIRKKINQRDRH